METKCQENINEISVEDVEVGINEEDKIEVKSLEIENKDILNVMEIMINGGYNLKQKLDKKNKKLVKLIILVNKTISETMPVLLQLNEDKNKIALLPTNIFKKSAHSTEMKNLLKHIQPHFSNLLASIKMPVQLSAELKKLSNLKKSLLKLKLVVLYRFFSSFLGLKNKFKIEKSSSQDDCEKEGDEYLSGNLNIMFRTSETNKIELMDSEDKKQQLEDVVSNAYKLLLSSESFTNKGFVFGDSSQSLNNFIYKPLNCKSLVPVAKVCPEQELLKLIIKPALPHNLCSIFSGSQRGTSDVASTLQSVLHTPPQTLLPTQPTTQQTTFSSQQLERTSLLPFRSAYSPLWLNSMNRLTLYGMPSHQRPQLFNQPTVLFNQPMLTFPQPPLLFTQPTSTFRNSAFNRPLMKFKHKNNQGSKTNKRILTPKKNSEDGKMNKIGGFSFVPTKPSKNSLLEQAKEKEESDKREWYLLKMLCSRSCRLVLMKTSLQQRCSESASKHLIVPYHSFKWTIHPFKPSTFHLEVVNKDSKDKTPLKKSGKNNLSSESSFCTASTDSLFHQLLDAAKMEKSPKKNEKSEKKKKKEMKSNKIHVKENTKYRMIEIQLNDSFDNNVECFNNNSQQHLTEYFVQQPPISTCEPPPVFYRLPKITATKPRKKNQTRNK